MTTNTGFGKLITPMTLYIDSDSLPKSAKEILIKTANRTRHLAVFVANRPITLPPSPYLTTVVVHTGFDKADDYIITHAKQGDIAITSDIPLAYEVMQHGAWALNAWGIIYSQQTIAQKRDMRDFLDNLRGSGLIIDSHQPPYQPKDKKRFADSLNQLLDKSKRQQSNMQKTHK